MGNAWFCARCDQSSISVSKGCLDRFINEETGEQFTSEEIWMNKLRCLDNHHSEKTGINKESFETSAEALERDLRIIKELPCRQREKVIECIQKNPGFLINCLEEMDNFMHCVDALRITTIKKRIVEQRKAAKQANLNKKS